MALQTQKNKNPRYVAFKILGRVEAGEAYADILLARELTALKGPDRAFAMELVYGVLRWQIKIDWIIDCFSKIKTKKLEHAVLNALRLGVYQLLFLTRVPPEAAVNETVELVKLEGPKSGGAKRTGYVNAVLKTVDSGREGIAFPVLSREPVEYISIVFSHPAWMVERWIKRYGVKEAIELCQANLKIPPTTLRVNTLGLTRDELIRQLTEEGFQVKKTVYSPEGIEVERRQKLVLPPPNPPDPFDPRYYIQDEASQLVARLLSPSPRETVLDACVAPGGKTTHIVQLMENTGLVVAMDKHKSRLKPLEEALKRFEIGIVETTAGDATEPLKFQPSLFHGQSWKLSVPREGFDAVLIDAPCTGLGVLRRKPDIKLKRTAEDVTELSTLQKRLLENLSKYVKKGGRLVYSACTLEPEETEDIIEGFLKKNGDFTLEDGAAYLPEPCRELFTGEYLTTYPHRHSMDGFFAARLKRT
jgi:16S rRNA (cytosine967-C5)-methyltransferase